VTERRCQLGMAMFLLSEAVFFFLLILACKYFAAIPYLSSRNGWILTILLLASSASMWRGWRWVTIALGVPFLLGLLGTLSSVLTAVLGLFLFAGMIALAIVPVSALRTMALYWYFLTAVWLAIFLYVYRGGVP
jgi:heme/copper-type cytochrome/quinol oxidase subunit 3